MCYWELIASRWVIGPLLPSRLWTLITQGFLRAATVRERYYRPQTLWYFGSFPVQLGHADAVYEGWDFLDRGGLDFGLEVRLEPFFLAASCEDASSLFSSRSAACSQRFQ